jgi:hypothetical protein
VQRIPSAILLSALALAGCAGHLAPQSRPEFIEKISEGGAFLMVDSYVARAGFDQVVATLRQKSGECLDGDTQVRRSSGGITAMQYTHHYRTQVRVVAAGRAELTTQFTSTNLAYAQQVPQGGFYDRAVDIERLSPTTTRLTYYGSSFASSKEAWAAMKGWSEGRSTACPG